VSIGIGTAFCVTVSGLAPKTEASRSATRATFIFNGENKSTNFDEFSLFKSKKSQKPSFTQILTIFKLSLLPKPFVKQSI
jgi:hypothetical protein